MALTITERAAGVFDVRLRQRNRKPEYFRVRGSRAQAEAAAERYASQTGLRPLDPATTTLGAWLRYLIANGHDLAPATRKLYAAYVNQWIDPHPAPAKGFWIGTRRLRDILPSDAGAWIAFATDEMPRQRLGWRDKGISARSMRDALKFMRWGFARAAALGMLIADNPFAHAKLPRAKRRPPQTPNRDHLLRLAECRDPRTRLLLMLAGHTGARRGELLALTWGDIDLRHKTLSIGASLEQNAPGTPPSLKEPKTPAGRRTIELGAIILAELRLARLAANGLMVAQRRRARTDATTSSRIEAMPIFAAGPAPDDWWSPDAASQAAGRALELLGIPGSLHTLRHAHATLLLSHGEISAHVVARRLGHAQVSTTLGIYAHAMPADDKLAAAAIDRLLLGSADKAGRA